MVADPPSLAPAREDRPSFVARHLAPGDIVAECPFGAGRNWARATHGNPWRFGPALVSSGLVLVAIAIAIGR